ncbi:orotate phosphoribosyltransferase [Nocardia xishanensis]|uniref:orotate phosphoribosyltransferase n=1 Tax=Nocardia xishanensis TaxID=238964 RepID=UPI0033E661C0
MTGALTDLARDVDARCRLRGSFTLRSGATGEEYFDKYLFETDPVLLRRVAEHMAQLLPSDVELLGGLELGGIPLVAVLSQITGLPALFVRKQAKDYGTRRLAEGDEPRGRRVVLIEDVITTGGAVRAAAEALRAENAAVDTVVCAIDRSTPGQNPLASAGIAIRCVFTKELLDACRMP